MVTFKQRATGLDGVVEVEIPYDVTGADDLRDCRRSKFEPMNATVTFRDGKPYCIRFHGRRHDQHRSWTDAPFFLAADGSVTDALRNPDVPPIVAALIEDASQHPAVLACLATAAADEPPNPTA